MGKNPFDKNLDYGKRAEMFILDKITLKYPHAYMTAGYNPGYDICVPDKKIKIEVKLDTQSFRTGNVAVEHEHRGKPSALSITTSDSWAWVFFDRKGGYLIYGFINPDTLKDVCEKYARTYGDDNPDHSGLWILPAEKLVYHLDNPRKVNDEDIEKFFGDFEV